MASKKVKERKAEHGEKMIEIKIRFFTNEIAEKDGNIIPKHAWTRGMVRMEKNDAHGVVPKRSKPFNSLMEIPSVIEQVLTDHGITLHLSYKMIKYFENEE